MNDYQLMYHILYRFIEYGAVSYCKWFAKVLAEEAVYCVKL